MVEIKNEKILKFQRSWCLLTVVLFAKSFCASDCDDKK